METIVSTVAIFALFVAMIGRVMEAHRDEKRLKRNMKRTNENPWNRSSQ